MAETNWQAMRALLELRASADLTEGEKSSRARQQRDITVAGWVRDQRTRKWRKFDSEEMGDST